jgi:hypothetical protein
MLNTRFSPTEFIEGNPLFFPPKDVEKNIENAFFQIHCTKILLYFFEEIVKNSPAGMAGLPLVRTSRNIGSYSVHPLELRRATHESQDANQSWSRHPIAFWWCC